MRQMIIHSVAGFLLLAGPSVAFAECTIGDAKSEQELAKIEGIRSGEYGTIRRDMRSLRSAAAVLDRYGKDEACQEVVAAINELLRDPKAASELRSKSMMKTVEEPAATTETKTEDQAATETKTDELKVLQHIADSVVDELSRTAAYQATDKTKLYHRVGKQVFKECVIGDDLLSVDEIKRAVLAKFQN